jgi:serine/threonine protein kinase
MSLLKSVRNKLFTSSKNKTKKSKDDEITTTITKIEDDSVLNEHEQSSLNTINKKLSLSTQSLFEKINNYAFIIDKDPHEDWLDLNKSVVDDANNGATATPIEDLNDDYSFNKTYLNITTETKSTCRIIKKFSNDCLDDYLVEIGILDESGFKFDEHMSEIELLRQCRHKNILSIFDVYFYDMKLYVFTEYCANGSLGQLLTDLEQPLSQIQIHYVLTELLQGLFYLHDQLKICHNDIRADNILITAGGEIKISNFMVWAKNNSKLAKKNYFYIKSPHWMAPEVAKGKMNKEELDENFKADIWSLGITCIEMANLYPPNSTLSADSVILEISNLIDRPYVNLSHSWSNNFVDFIQQCLDINYETRPSAANLFSVSIFNNILKNSKKK